MPNLLEQAPLIDTALLDSLDFDPAFLCEGASHEHEGTDRPPAVWRITRKHTTAGCDRDAEEVLCDDCLRGLARISSQFVICTHCYHGSFARNWWRLIGGI